MKKILSKKLYELLGDKEPKTPKRLDGIYHPTHIVTSYWASTPPKKEPKK